MVVISPAVREALLLSFDALRRYKLRTALSVLGVVAGVAAVVAMMAVAEGGRRRILAQIESLGLTNMVIRPNMANPDVARRSHGIAVADRSRMEALVPSARYVSGLAQRFLTVSGPAAHDLVTVFGVEPTFATIMHLDVARGRFLHPLDQGSPVRVAVIGQVLAKRLFGTSDPLLRKIRIDGAWYEVIGVLSDRPLSKPASDAPLAPFDFGGAALVPVYAMLDKPARFAVDRPLDEIWIQAASPAALTSAAQTARRAFARLHNGLDDFEVVLPRDLLDQQLRTQRTFDVIVGSIAVLALLVGGIGIMNIMLATVLERTPEIGLRRTVGATRRWVAGQFLAEAVIMTAAGGVGGILSGVAISWAIAHFAQWPVFVGMNSIAAALAVSAGAGITFGAYPALRAARLQPIDAVRYE
jgi:putative ABC transport system permease protein